MESNVIYGHCGQPAKVQENPELWEVVVDYYPESRSFIEYHFDNEEEVLKFCEDWHEHNPKT